MTEIWYVEDYMSRQVIDHKYFATKAAAVEFRNRLGYGLVLSHEFQNGGTFKPGCGKCPLGTLNGPCGTVSFRAVPGEKVEIS